MLPEDAIAGCQLKLTPPILMMYPAGRIMTFSMQR
jgi:hypothetical protein